MAAGQKLYEKEEFERLYLEERAERKLAESRVEGLKGDLKWQAGEIQRLKKAEKRVEELELEQLCTLKENQAQMDSFKKRFIQLESMCVEPP